MRWRPGSEWWKSAAVVLALIALLLFVTFVSGGGVEPDFIPAKVTIQTSGPAPTAGR